jgi:hypothetical protein
LRIWAKSLQKENEKTKPEFSDEMKRRKSS